VLLIFSELEHAIKAPLVRVKKGEREQSESKVCLKAHREENKWKLVFAFV
jgi:hypothetical protein